MFDTTTDYISVSMAGHRNWQNFLRRTPMSDKDPIDQAIEDLGAKPARVGVAYSRKLDDHEYGNVTVTRWIEAPVGPGEDISALGDDLFANCKAAVAAELMSFIAKRPDKKPESWPDEAAHEATGGPVAEQPVPEGARVIDVDPSATYQRKVTDSGLEMALLRIKPFVKYGIDAFEEVASLIDPNFKKLQVAEKHSLAEAGVRQVIVAMKEGQNGPTPDKVIEVRR
jgi:hypothetical protein